MSQKKCRIRYKRLFLFILIILVFVLLIIKYFKLNITNIYVSGNDYFSDQYIIELAEIENYPNAFITFSSNLETKISDNEFIDSVQVKKRGFTKIYIDVVENRPLFYDEKNNRTVLLDGSFSSKLFDVPIVVNYIDSSIYNEFLSKMSVINIDILNNISEIEYTPNSVDDELFLFTMKDGNYIYINLDKFDSLNNYLDIVVKFNNRKGILYLDSGEYFKILEN